MINFLSPAFFCTLQLISDFWFYLFAWILKVDFAWTVEFKKYERSLYDAQIEDGDDITVKVTVP